MTEQAAKPTAYATNKQQGGRGDNSTLNEGPWGTAEVASYSAAGVNLDNLSGPYGFHNGANVALCDGAVLLLDEALDFAVLSAMLSRDGQEIIDSRDWQPSRR
jgi:hypothetical protein